VVIGSASRGVDERGIRIRPRGRGTNCQAGGGRWSGRSSCCRTGPEEEPDDPDVTVASDGVETALGLALEKPQGKDVALFGASLAAQCLRAGLVGELEVHIIPVLLRHGTPLFPNATRCLSKVVESYQAG
jgi:hypothetical protein